MPDELGAPLVHRERRRHHAAAGVGDAEQLERALHRAVLAEAAVQRDEARASKPSRFSSQRSRSRRIEGMRIDALRAQRREHAVAAASARSRARRSVRPSARRPCRIRAVHARLPDDPHFAARARRPSSRSTVRCTCSISASMSAALAAPLGLTMKFACFSETRAPPTRAALEPAGLDQPRGVVARRIAEHAARVGQRQRLASRCACASSSLIVSRDAVAVARAASGTTPRRTIRRRAAPSQRARGDSRSSYSSRRAHRAARRRDRWSRRAHDVPGLAAVAAGVHRERAADRAGNAGEELRAGEIVHRREARDLRAGDAGFGVDREPVVPSREQRARRRA